MITEKTSCAGHTVAVYRSPTQVEIAITKLASSGFSIRNVSIVGPSCMADRRQIEAVRTARQSFTWDNSAAIFWGYMRNLLVDSAMLIVPNVGTVLLGGWMASKVEGPLARGVNVTFGEAMTGIGIPIPVVRQYEENLKSGNLLLIARGNPVDVYFAKGLLVGSGAASLDSFSPMQGVGGR